MTIDREAIERRAEDLLARLPSYVWDGESLPVPVERIADTHYGLLVRDVSDLSAAPGAPALRDGQGLSGLLLPDRGEIWVNADEARQWPGRRRFTIGHEIGHHVMHVDDGGGVFCRPNVVEEDETGERPPLPPAEDEANVFAAALLMPRWLFCRDYRSKTHDFHALVQRYGTSMAALGRRLQRAVPGEASDEWTALERAWQRRMIDRWARHLDECDADASRARVSAQRLLALAWRDRFDLVLADPEAAPAAMLARNCRPALIWAAADLALRWGARGADRYARAAAGALALDSIEAGAATHLAAAARCAERALNRAA